MRNNSDVNSNYKDITLIPSSLLDLRKMIFPDGFPDCRRIIFCMVDGESSMIIPWKNGQRTLGHMLLQDPRRALDSPVFLPADEQTHISLTATDRFLERVGRVGFHEGDHIG